MTKPTIRHQGIVPKAAAVLAGRPTKGTYRTVVLPDHGYVAGVSNAVHLKK